MPREVEIPLWKNGLPEKWCSFHQSSNHNLDDCREINDIPIRKKNGECYTCGELGHISRDCPPVTGPRKAKARKGAPQQGKHAKIFADASTQTEEDTLKQRPLVGPNVTISSQEQTFVHGGTESGEWDLPGHVVTIHPGAQRTPSEILDCSMVGLGVTRISSQALVSGPASSLCQPDIFPPLQGGSCKRKWSPDRR